MEWRTIGVSLVADDSRLSAGLDRGARKVKSFDDQVDRSSKRVGKSFDTVGSSASKMASSIGLAVGGAAVVKFFTSSSAAASDMAESVSKSAQVFGPLQSEILSFAEGSAKSMGLAKQETIEATSTLGNLFTAMKIGVRPAADMSKGLVKLSSDLASFNNEDPTEVLLALRSGLVGETEPLRRFGIDLNEATLKAKALELGLSDGKATLTASAKAQAAYAIIMEQTTTAQGDFARTSGGLANRQRILNATWKDGQAKLGEALLPAMQVAVTVGLAFLTTFGKIPPVAQAVVVGFTAIGLAALLMGGRIREGAAASAAFGRGIGSGFETVALKAMYAKDAILKTAVALRTSFAVDGVSGVARSMAGLGSVSVGAGAVAAGALVGIAAGAKLAGDLLERSKSKAEEFVATLTEGVEFGTIDQINAKLVELKAKQDAAAIRADRGTPLNELGQDLNPIVPNTRRDAKAKVDALDAEILALEQKRNELIGVKNAEREARDAQIAATKTVREATIALGANAEATSERTRVQLAARSATRSVADATAEYLANEEAAAGRGEQISQIRAEAARQQVADQRSIADAVKAVDQARRGELDAARGVTDALRGKAAALRAEQDAQARLEELEGNRLTLQRNLIQAWKDGAVALEAQQDAAKGDALSVKEAEINLADARQALLDGPDDFTDPNAMARLQIAVQRAELALAAAKRQADQSAADAAKATSAGVAGSEPVVAAQDAIAANDAAIEDQKQTVSDAAYAVEQADQRIIDSHQAVIDAQTRTQDAIAGVADAREAAAARQVTAEQDVMKVIDEAKSKQDELRDNAILAFAGMVTAGLKAGIPWQVLVAQLDVAIAKLAPGSPLWVGLRDLANGIANPYVVGGLNPQGGYTLGGLHAPPRASGGPVRRGMPYVVGEHRPELFVPAQDGRIVASVPSTWGTFDPRPTPQPTPAPVVQVLPAPVVVQAGPTNNIGTVTTAATNADQLARDIDRQNTRPGF